MWTDVTVHIGNIKLFSGNSRFVSYDDAKKAGLFKINSWNFADTCIFSSSLDAGVGIKE